MLSPGAAVRRDSELNRRVSDNNANAAVPSPQSPPRAIPAPPGGQTARLLPSLFFDTTLELRLRVLGLEGSGLVRPARRT